MNARMSLTDQWPPCLGPTCAGRAFQGRDRALAPARRAAGAAL